MTTPSRPRPSAAGGAPAGPRAGARLTTALVVPVVALVLAGCAGGAGGAATPAPSVPSETPPPAEGPGDAVDEGPEVLGERWQDAPTPDVGPDGVGEPAAGWVDPGSRFFVTTFGSSSCPLAPTGLQPSAAAGALTIEFTRVGGPMCTMDFSPASWVLDVPAELADAAPLTVTLAGEVDPAVEVVLER